MFLSIIICYSTATDTRKEMKPVRVLRHVSSRYLQAFVGIVAAQKCTKAATLIEM